MLTRINYLLEHGETFAFETTLATKSYKHFLRQAQSKGYVISMIFFWLESVELAKERVKTRVSEGGHNIADDIIERLYQRGIKNLFDIYLPLVDSLFIFDNSSGQQQLIARNTVNNDIDLLDEIKYRKLIAAYDNY